jgi:hypothetical protein
MIPANVFHLAVAKYVELESIRVMEQKVVDGIPKANLAISASSAAKPFPLREGNLAVESRHTIVPLLKKTSPSMIIRKVKARATATTPGPLPPTWRRCFPTPSSTSFTVPRQDVKRIAERAHTEQRPLASARLAS